VTTRLSAHFRSNVVSYLALVVALSGTAYAAHENIRSSDIVNNQVKTIDVRNDSLPKGGLTKADLRPNSVGGSEAINNALTGTDINESTLSVLHSTRVVSVDGTGNLEPTCGPGEVATGGGYTQVASDVVQFRPQQTSGTPVGWSVAQTNASDEYNAYVICSE
jgi:hypothetical protein